MQGPAFVTAGPDDTRALAAAAAAHLEPGDVVALCGDLGAGKTCFVQGAATALGVTARVTSPTFVLVRSYPGTPGVVHVDAYRLDHLREFVDLDDDVGAPDRITFVEWGDAVAQVLPTDRLEVLLRWRDDDSRDVSLRAYGAWCQRLPRVVEALRPWRAQEG